MDSALPVWMEWIVAGGVAAASFFFIRVIDRFQK